LGDSDLRAYVLSGLTNGFCLSFNESPLVPTYRNSPSALANPSIVEQMLAKEVSSGAMAGPFPTPPLPDLQVSRFSLKEKPNNSGWRFLFDLSYPDKQSVNAGIPKEAAAVSYVKVSDICDKILNIGRGALLCKFDISRAYRHVPVCPADRRLLGLTWNSLFYIDLTLPFGGRPCCSIFNAVGDLFTAIFNHYSSLTDYDHYLDDFLGVADPSSLRSVAPIEADFKRTLSLCDHLGIPLADKTVHPTTRLTFLGFILDSEDLTISLPEEKKSEYISEIEKVSTLHAVKKKRLESLIGKLMHATTVIPIGRAFFRSLIAKSSAAPLPTSWISLARDERLNLSWWVNLLSDWNGISLMRFCGWLPLADFELSSDAALTIGLGIVNGNDWVAATWPPSAPTNIAILEMIPLVISAIIWGDTWTGKSILFHTDSMAVVFSAESLLPKDPQLAALVRELSIISIQKGFRFRVDHVPGVSNVLADLLSRSKFDEFFEAHPTANPSPVNFDIDSQIARLVTLGLQP
jgi:hypothetical protein